MSGNQTSSHLLGIEILCLSGFSRVTELVEWLYLYLSLSIFPFIFWNLLEWLSGCRPTMSRFEWKVQESSSFSVWWGWISQPISSRCWNSLVGPNASKEMGVLRRGWQAGKKGTTETLSHPYPYISFQQKVWPEFKVCHLKTLIKGRMSPCLKWKTTSVSSISGL